MMKNGLVLVLKGISQYDILRIAADEVAIELDRIGYDVILLDLTIKKDYIDFVNYLNNKPIEFVFVFNGILLDMTDNSGNYILNSFNVPIITYLVDNPMYHYNRLNTNYKNLSIATFDRENVELLKRYKKDLRNVEFVPFIGFQGERIRPFVEREMDILFVGTYSDPEINKKQISELPGIFKTVAENVVEILLKNTSLSIEKALKKYLDDINFIIEEDEFLELLSTMTSVDQYVRNYFRDKVVRTILDAKFKLYVYGSGWNSLKDQYGDNLVILNEAEANLLTGIDYMGNAKIVLSVMPWFKDCIQDRIISTMINGAISITDPSIYMEEEFQDGEDIVFYSLDHLEELPEKIKNLLNEDKKASEIAYNGYKKVKDVYTIESFVRSIVDSVPRNYKLHAREDIINRYENSNDIEIKQVIDFVKRNGAGVYNYDYIFKYAGIKVDIGYDTEFKMYYVFHNGKKMYYPKTYTNPEAVAQNYRFISLEQDLESPHRYLDDTVYVKEGDVVIDAGVAEGNFSLDVIDKVSKLYIIECDKHWIEALEQTFKPYSDKVVFVNKFLSNKNDESNVTIDALVTEKINFIKMDIEGAELDALEGAHNTFLASDNLTCAVCSYHKKNDEVKIKEVLEKYNFNISTTKGYMFFIHDSEALKESELRRGIVRGIIKE